MYHSPQNLFKLSSLYKDLAQMKKNKSYLITRLLSYLYEKGSYQAVIPLYLWSGIKIAPELPTPFQWTGNGFSSFSHALNQYQAKSGRGKKCNLQAECASNKHLFYFLTWNYFLPSIAQHLIIKWALGHFAPSKSHISKLFLTRFTGIPKGGT